MPVDKIWVGLVEVDYTMNRQISDALKQNLALIVHRYNRHISFIGLYYNTNYNQLLVTYMSFKVNLLYD